MMMDIKTNNFTRSCGLVSVAGGEDQPLRLYIGDSIAPVITASTTEEMAVRIYALRDMLYTIEHDITSVLSRDIYEAYAPKPGAEEEQSNESV